MGEHDGPTPPSSEAPHLVVPTGFSECEVKVRLARYEEYAKWDALMRCHRLGFRKFKGAGLRYLAESNGLWIALAGWQIGASRCRARDRWIGWRSTAGWHKRHVAGHERFIANNTRFLIIKRPTAYLRLLTHMMREMVRNISADSETICHRPLLILESFVPRETIAKRCMLSLGGAT